MQRFEKRFVIVRVTVCWGASYRAGSRWRSAGQDHHTVLSTCGLPCMRLPNMPSYHTVTLKMANVMFPETGSSKNSSPFYHESRIYRFESCICNKIMRSDCLDTNDEGYISKWKCDVRLVFKWTSGIFVRLWDGFNWRRQGLIGYFFSNRGLVRWICILQN